MTSQFVWALFDLDRKSAMFQIPYAFGPSKLDYLCQLLTSWYSICCRHPISYVWCSLNAYSSADFAVSNLMRSFWVLTYFASRLASVNVFLLTVCAFSQCRFPLEFCSWVDRIGASNLDVQCRLESKSSVFGRLYVFFFWQRGYSNSKGNKVLPSSLSSWPKTNIRIYSDVGPIVPDSSAWLRVSH